MNDKPAPLNLVLEEKSIRVWHEIGADRTSDRALAEGRPPKRGWSKKRREANLISSKFAIAAMD